MTSSTVLLLSFFLQPGTPPAAPVEIDPVLMWLQRLSLGSAAAGILLVLFLIFTQRRLGENLLKWLSLGGIVLLPLLAIGMGNIAGLAQAKKVEFCNSCHLTMSVFVKDMKDPNSTTLAALHYRHRWIPEAQCYACHTSYGMFGDVQAKMRGVEDFFKYYTGTYTLPTRLHDPYPNADCLKCHERAPKFVGSEAHAESLAEIRRDELRCVDCHQPAHGEQVAYENSLGR